MTKTAFHTGLFTNIAEKKFAVILCSTKVLDGKVGDRYYISSERHGGIRDI